MTSPTLDDLIRHSQLPRAAARRLLARLLDGGGNGAAAGAHARQVHEDQVAALGELIDRARVPIIQVGSQVHEHDEGAARGYPVGNALLWRREAPADISR